LCAVGTADPDGPPTFLEIKKIMCNDEGRNIITLSYFLFTTLSTTGFGDYHPRSDYERLACS